MQPKSQFSNIPSSSLPLPVFQQETHPLPIVPTDSAPLSEEKPSPLMLLKTPSRKWIMRVVASGITLLLLLALYIIWFTVPSTSTSSSPTGISQQSFGPSGQTSSASTPTGGDLHVYVTGSVRHPGMYTLPPGARVYQLLQAAGGALPQADLVSLNLAAPLTANT